MNNKEAVLIELAQNGKLSSFEQLIKPYESKVFNFLLKMCKNKEAAEDQMQETFINVFKKIGDFRKEAKFSTWVFQIAVNNCLMLKRKLKDKHQDILDENIAQFNSEEENWQANPEEIYQKKELKELLDRALAELPEIYRAVFLLKDVEGFRSQEIAELLKISLPNVKARILRARKMLRDILSAELAGERK